MTIYSSDRVEARGPLPLDAKMYVGAGAEYLYDTKEDIPASYRYRGMVVYEIPISIIVDTEYPVYQLQGGITNSNWIRVSTGTSPGGTIGTARILSWKSIASADQSVFALPVGYLILNTSVYINGILITNTNSTTSEYDIIDNVTYTSLEFTFDLEAGWEVVAINHINV